METRFTTYITFLAAHVGLGFLGILYPPVIKYVLLLAIVYFLMMIIRTANSDNHALLGAAYIAGFEVFSRMTGGAFSYEFAKYMVIGFLGLGMFYRGFQRASWPYLFYLLCLVPGVLMSAINLSFNAQIGNALGFNLSGPVCLGISALYGYQNPITQQRFNTVMELLIYPLVATVTYVILYAPSLEEVITGTGSNFAASGGFGPNQVSTVIGLGMFLLFSRLFMVKDRLYNLVDLFLLAVFTYRGLATFSRGGMIAAILCMALFLIYFLLKADGLERMKWLVKTGVLSFLFLVIWSMVSLTTDGLLDKRYANQDARGRDKATLTTGRTQLANIELDAFLQNPVLGVGVGKGKELRAEQGLESTASHNEISRLLAEHGSFGILALMILLVAPLVMRFRDRSNVYVYAFVAFWFLTINHSAMRIAMTAFIYGLALLQIIPNEETSPEESWP